MLTPAGHVTQSHQDFTIAGRTEHTYGCNATSYTPTSCLINPRALAASLAACEAKREPGNDRRAVAAVPVAEAAAGEAAVAVAAALVAAVVEVAGETSFRHRQPSTQVPRLMKA